MGGSAPPVLRWLSRIMSQVVARFARLRAYRGPARVAFASIVSPPCTAALRSAMSGRAVSAVAERVTPTDASKASDEPYRSVGKLWAKF